jgi:hypothetical protein
VTLAAAALAAAPANDTQAGAVVLALAQPATVDTAEATIDAAESATALGCSFAAGAQRGVWFRFTTPGSGVYLYDARASDFPVVISLKRPDGTFGGCSSTGEFATQLTAGQARDIFVAQRSGTPPGGTVARITVTGPAGSGTTTTPTTPTDPEEGGPEEEGGGAEDPDGGGTTTRPDGPARVPAPRATTAPAMRLDVAHVGQTLVVQTGRWDVRVTTKVAWMRGTRAIPRATRLRYTLQRADIGRRVSARITVRAVVGGATTVVTTPGVMVRR